MIYRSARFFIEDITDKLIPWYEGRSSAQRTAWLFLEKITKKKMSELLVAESIGLSQKDYTLLHQWIRLHTQDYYPLQYILETMFFGSVEVMVNPPTLIPRPETEEWVMDLVKSIKKNINQDTSFFVLDMCTGSGCIGLFFAKEFPQARILAVDIADDALKLAQHNADLNELTNIHFLKSSLFDQLNQETSFDIILSNPPYVSYDEWHTLSPVITQWEDRAAFVADNNGLSLLIELIYKAPFFLKKDSIFAHKELPRLVTEIGYTQGLAVVDLFKKSLFNNVQVVQDSFKKDRIVLGF